MLTISRYLLAEFGKASATVFAGLYLVFLAADTLLHADDFASDAGAALRDVLGSSLELVSVGVPIACATGVVWSLTRSVRFREVTAIRCAGVPLRRVLAPILGASLLLAAAVGVFEDRLVVPVRVALEGTRSAGETPETRVVRAQGRYWHSNDRAWITAQRFDSESGTLYGVSAFLYDENDRVRERIEAESASNLSGEVWEFRDAVVLTFGDPTGLQRRSALALRQSLGVSAGDVLRAATAPQMTTLHKLARRIREHRGDAEELHTLKRIFHSRLAQPLALVILVLAAIPIAIGDVERGDSLPRSLLLALGAVTVYWTAWGFAQLVARDPAIPAALPVWGMTSLALGAALLRWRSIPE